MSSVSYVQLTMISYTLTLKFQGISLKKKKKRKERKKRKEIAF